MLRTLRTARHIPLRQLAARARFLWLRKRYVVDPSLPFVHAAIDAAGMTPVAALPRLRDDVLWPEGLDAVERRAADLSRGRFAYLNRAADFSDGIRWRDEGASPLWIYQLQYLGAVADLARTGRVADAAKIVAAWRAEFEGRWDAVAWHPYPASMRFVNLCAAASAAGGFDALGPGVSKLAAVHAAYILRHVEHDVRGNHILENARALLWAGRVFRGGCAGECERVARAILEAEIEEQVLADGGHFEMSPMYHGIVLRDLLEVRELLAADNSALMKSVDGAVRRMGEFLAGVLCPDGDIPLLGDSVRGFGPPPAVLLRLADVAPTEWSGVRAFPDTGLHVLRNERVWSVFDTGRVCPPYLPAHAQADTLTIEVWVDGTPVVCDPGVFDYSGAERAWGRSSRAHSTLTIDDADTSEVYGSFRCGGRASVQTTAVTAESVTAVMRPWNSSARLVRTVSLLGESLVVEDRTQGAVRGTVRSRLHLDPRTSHRRVEEGGVFVGAHSAVADIDTMGGSCRFENGHVSREFGRSEASTILVQDVPPGGRVRWVIGRG